jgi:hypothetical protein
MKNARAKRAGRVGNHQSSGPIATPAPTAQPICRAIAPASIARLRRLAERLHALGPRPLFEFLREIVAGADPMARLERYAELERGDDIRTLRAILKMLLRRYDWRCVSVEVNPNSSE